MRNRRPWVLWVFLGLVVLIGLGSVVILVTRSMMVGH